MAKAHPKIAIITRTKDRPIFLERAISSVHKQTEKDFIQVIINDAGDPERVDEIIAKYADLIGNRVKVIHNTESKGMEAASNKAIKSVESEYIAIHDDDDTWHPEFLQKTVQHLENTQMAGVVVRTDKITEEVKQSFIKHIKTEQWMPQVKAINLYRQCAENQMTPITFLYRRSVLDEIGYYDESLLVCGDWDFGIRFMQKYDVEFLDPGYALANYHHRKYREGAEGNTSYAGNDKARYFTNKLMNKYLREELAEGKLGVGYIMSKTRYNQSYLSQLFRNVLPSRVFSKMKRIVHK